MQCPGPVCKHVRERTHGLDAYVVEVVSDVVVCVHTCRIKEVTYRGSAIAAGVQIYGPAVSVEPDLAGLKFLA